MTTNTTRRGHGPWAFVLGVVVGASAAMLVGVVGDRSKGDTGADPAAAEAGAPRPVRPPPVAVRGPAVDPSSCEPEPPKHHGCCEALERCLEREATRAGAWPDTLRVGPAERPEVWTDAVAEAVDACDIAGELVDFDCSDYPCIGLLQFEGDGKASEAAQQTATERWRSCRLLAERMGWGPDAPARGAADIEWIDTPRCPGRSLGVLLAFSPDGSAVELAAPGLEGLGDPVWLELSGSIMERAGRAMRRWSCEGTARFGPGAGGGP